MNRTLGRFLFWSPRILGIAFAAFISIFALDVFEEGSSILATIIALLIHLIPTAIVVVILVISWRWEWLGAILFTSLGLLYLVMAWARFHWSAYLVISGPLFVLGFLFFLNWIYRKEIAHAPPNSKSS